MPSSIDNMLGHGKVVFKTVNGDKLHYYRGQLHCDYGPAVERVNGNSEWWINGQRVAPFASVRITLNLSTDQFMLNNAEHPTNT